MYPNPLDIKMETNASVLMYMSVDEQSVRSVRSVRCVSLHSTVEGGEGVASGDITFLLLEGK